MHQDLSWSPTAFTGAYSVAMIVSGVAAIPVGRWLDRHGARGLMAAGSAAAILLVLAWAHVTDLAAFYSIWVGIRRRYGRRLVRARLRRHHHLVR